MQLAGSEHDYSLVRILPMIHSIVLSSWDREKYPYTKSQMIIFIALHRRETMTMKEAAAYISSSKEQATRAVASLVDHGLVERYIDPANRNFIHIRLTQAGRIQAREMLDNLYENVNLLLNRHLDEEEKISLRNAIVECVRLLEKVL